MAVGLFILVVVLAVAALASRPSAIEDAATKCKTTSNLQDGGAAISFNTQGSEDTSGDTIVEVVCVLTELKVPQHVITHIDQTRALDGQQTDAWGDYSARWSYHPNAGLSITVLSQ